MLLAVSSLIFLSTVATGKQEYLVVLMHKVFNLMHLPALFDSLYEMMMFLLVDLVALNADLAACLAGEILKKGKL